MNFRLSRESKYVSALPASRWGEQLRRRILAGLGSVAFTAALGFGMPSIARASEVADTGDNVSMEQVDTTIESAPVVEQTATVESAPVVEQSATEESAPVVEQTTTEESAPVVEQTVTEESTPVVEQSTTEESAPVVEQTTTEESAKNNSDSTTIEENNNSEGTKEVTNIAPGKPSVEGNYEVVNEKTETSYEVTEKQTTSRAAFTVVEKNGTVYVFTAANEDELSQEMLSRQLEEWWNANYGANGTVTHVYSISKLGEGTKTIGEDGVVVSVDNGNITIVDDNVTKTETLDNNFETISKETNTKQETKDTQSSEIDTKTEVKEDTKVETKSVTISDNDYIIITGKDGSITIGYKYILGAKGYGKILESLDLPEGTKINTPILLPTKLEEGISQKSSLTAGDLTISTEDGINYVITGEGASDVRVSSDSTKQLEEAADKSENGNLKEDQGKPDHDELVPDKPTPNTPEPKTPTPNTPEPKTPTPDVPSKPSVPSILPQTGDNFNRGIANTMAALGVTLLSAGILSRRMKLFKSNANCALLDVSSEYKKARAKQMMANHGLALAGKTI